MKILGIRVPPLNEWSSCTIKTVMGLCVVAGYVVGVIRYNLFPPTAKMGQPCAVGCNCGCKCDGTPGNTCKECRPKPWRGD